MSEQEIENAMQEDKPEDTEHVFAKPELSPKEVEKLEEAKLKAKFPMAHNVPLSGHSAFLQKKLAKGQKYFDSGDYQMAKQSTVLKTRQLPQATGTVPLFGTGDAIPTPESVPARKTSIIQPKFTSAS